jgi:hypothetical protein
MASTIDMTEKPPAARESQHVDDIVAEKDQGTIPWDDETLRQEKRLVRKLDMTLMPMVWVLYLFNYLDRNNIAWVLPHLHSILSNGKQTGEAQLL